MGKVFITYYWKFKKHKESAGDCRTHFLLAMLRKDLRYALRLAKFRKQMKLS